MTRNFGVSILTASGLTSAGELLFSRDGILKAAIAASKAGLGIQMLPLATIGSWRLTAFEQLLQDLRKHNVDVLTFEDRWGGDQWTHPWVHDLLEKREPKAVVAYYLMFPWFYTGVKNRIELLRRYYPRALGIDLPAGKVFEINPNVALGRQWIKRISSADDDIKYVIDTHHLLEFGGLKTAEGILNFVLRRQNNAMAAIHVQFRKKELLEEFMSGRGASLALLANLKLYAKGLPVIFELTPELCTIETLNRMRQVVDGVID